MYVDHILAIRSHSFYRNALMIIIIEANNGGWLGAQRVADLLQPNPKNIDAVLRHRELTKGQSLGPLLFMQKDPEGGVDRGVWTSDEQLDGGAELLRESLREKNLRIADQFVSQDSKAFLTKFRAQLLNFREQIKEAPDPVFGKLKRRYTGKMGGQQDDTVVIVMLMKFWFRVLKRMETFRNHCRQNGIPLY